MATSLAVPVAYITVLVTALAIFSRVYRRRKLGTHLPHLLSTDANRQRNKATNHGSPPTLLEISTSPSYRQKIH